MKNTIACGVTKLDHSRKNARSSILRSQLITIAMALVNQIAKRISVAEKETWIQGLPARREKSAQPLT